VKQIDIGIFLHRVSFSESSWITTFYTQKSGIKQFIFRGAKRKKYYLSPLSICELTYYVRTDSELYQLTHIDTNLVCKTIFSDSRKHILAFFIADVIRKSIKNSEPELPLFDFFKRTILEIENAENLAYIPLFFLANFTQYIGIKPNMCDRYPNYFDINQGEFYSNFHDRKTRIESGQIVQALFSLFFYETNNFVASIHLRKEMLNVLLRYYATHIPYFDVSKSLEIIREILQESPIEHTV